LALVLPISKRRQEDKVFLMNKEEKLKNDHQKLFTQFFIRNLLPAKRFSKSCQKTRWLLD